MQKNLNFKHDILSSNETTSGISQEMMDRFRKRKCFADTELEQLASQSFNQTSTINSKLMKYQTCTDMANLVPSENKQPNFHLTNQNYVMDTFVFNNYFSQLANLTKANIWYLQASLNGQKNINYDFFKANFNCLNLNQIDSPTLTELSSEREIVSPSNEFSSNSTRFNNCIKSKLDWDDRDKTNKLAEFKIDYEKNLTKEKYSGKAKSFSVDSLLGVVK